MPPISYNGRRALAHLKKLRPNAGWAIDMNKSSKEYRLLRRGGVPLTQRYFKDIHHDAATGNVVGIISKGPPTKAQVLVDDQGKPVGGSQPAIINITTWSNTAKARPKQRRRSEHQKSNRGEYSLTEEHDNRLIKGALYITGVAIAIKATMNFLEAFHFFMIPIIYFFAFITAPSENDFSVDQEVKQILLRRHQLYDDSSEKTDEDWINEKMKRIEVRGKDYEISIINIGGAARFAFVKIPSVNRKFFWMGVFRKWRHLFSLTIESKPQEVKHIPAPGE